MADSSPIDVGHLIRSRRIALGLSQARLGALVDRTATTIRRWERGEVEPPADMVAPLAAALEVDVAELRQQPQPEQPTAATVVVSSPTAPPRPAAPEEPAPEPPTVVQPVPVAGEGDRPKEARPPARPEPTPTPPPDRPPPRPDVTKVAPLRPGSTDREDAEPWIHFETEAIPPAAQPLARPLPTPSPPAPVSITDQPTQEVAAPPPPMPQPRVQVVQPKSYLEDPKQRVLYLIRMLLTLALLGIMAVVLFWAVGEFLEVMDDALDLFSETTEATELTPAPVP